MSTARRTHRVALLAGGGVLGAAVGLGGLARAGIGGDPPDPERPLPSKVAEALTDTDGSHPYSYAARRDPVGPKMSRTSARHQVLDALTGSAGVYDVRFSVARRSSLEPDLPWIDIYLDGNPDCDREAVALIWKAALVQGAIADLLRDEEAATSEVIGGSRVFVRLPSGRLRRLAEGGRSFIAAGQSFAGQVDGRDDVAIVESAQKALLDHGLVDPQVEVLRPLGPAVSVVATAPDDLTVDWTIDDLSRAINGSPTAYEGLLITIVDPSGTPLIVSGAALRTGLGGLSFAPGQDTRFGAVHG